MTEEKSKDELEKMTKKLSVVAMVGVALMVFGGGISLWSIVSFDDQMIPDNEHITDQGMPIRDLENATYTWTSEEIADMAKERVGILTVAAFTLIPGVALFYCSECGLKLEKKG